MSANQAPHQISPAEALRSVMGSSAKLAALAAACMLLFLLLPTLRVSGSVMGIATAASFSGGEMGGWAAWVALLAFAAAAATRFVSSIAQYRRILDLAAFAMVAVVLVYAALASPIATAAQQVHQAQAQFGGLMGGGLGGSAGGFGRAPVQVQSPVSFSVLPHVGALFFVAAPVFLFLAARRERATVVPTQRDIVP